MKKFNITNTRFIKSKTRKLAYSEHGKDIISKNKGLFKAFLEMDKQKLSKYKDPNNKFIIERLKVKRQSKNASETYKIIINGKIIEKYFVKEINEEGNPRNKYTFYGQIKEQLDGYHEMKAITILEDLGIDVIKAHFSYLNPYSKKTYIAYEFSNLKTVKELVKQKKISSEELQKIKNKILKLEIIIEDALKNKKNTIKYQTIPGITKVKETKHKTLTTNYRPTQISDINVGNTFYDPKTKKIYIFDPWYVDPRHITHKSKK
jgi:hypothetical protein